MIPNSPNAAPAIDTQMLSQMKLIMGAELQSLFIQYFIDDIPLQLEELRAAIVTMDITKIRQKSHRIKGESLQMGANQFAATCELIENMTKELGEVNEQKYHEYLEKLKIEFSRVKISLQQEKDHEN
jgi:HPt (histidine-containing phosphotransfer) domain-containing protein